MISRSKTGVISILTVMGLLLMTFSASASQTVTAGTLTAIGSDIDYDASGTYTLYVLKDAASPSGTGTDNRIHVVLDIGSIKDVDKIEYINRIIANANWPLNATTLDIFVADDESAAGFDPGQVSSFTTTVYSGAFNPNLVGSGQMRTADIMASWKRQYFLLDFTANGYGLINGVSSNQTDQVQLNDIRIVEVTVQTPLTVTAGTLTAIGGDLDYDAVSTYVCKDGASTTGAGTDNRIHAVLDIGSVKDVDKIEYINRIVAHANWPVNATLLDIFVADDESVISFDPSQVSSFATTVYSGAFNPNLVGSGQMRTADITNSWKRQYFLLDFTANGDGLIDGISGTGTDQVHFSDIQIEVMPILGTVITIE